MKQKVLFRFLMALCIISGCTKSDPHFTPVTPPPVVVDSVKSDKCLDFTLSDSTGYGTVEQFVFDSANRLVRHLYWNYGDSIANSSIVFIYEDGKLIKSYQYLGQSTIAYTTSNYSYYGNKLSTSEYYLGDLLLVHSQYTFDSIGRLSNYAQYADNMTYQYEGNYVVNLKYNDKSDMVAVTNSNGDSIMNCIGFDDHPNPFLNLPYDFAYDVPRYFPKYFSKHNYHRLDDYFYGINRWLYDYTYDNTDRVGKITLFNNFDVNNPLLANTMLVKYKCAP